ncbi:MAG TPA: dTDP-4-dehydrorhamnose reductase [Ilumatobacteraceae bacterium]|nr:dTDP-4-dehydrorhamnose reductase [Ilumatobacteraceae bacterium]
MKVAITGAGGQLGVDLVEHCTSMGDEVVALDRSSLDITDAVAVRELMSSLRPDAVINAAAYTAVDACETNRATAFAVNADAVGLLSATCELVGAHLVHVSTDYVFDGTLDRAYREDDATNPQSVYGQSKLAGEIAAGPDAAVARTSWVCGEHGNNMVKLVLRLAANPDQALAFVDDQRGHPTFTADLAPALRTLAVDRRSGIHHVTNDGAVSWYEFVRDVLAAAGHDPDRVRPIATADLDPPRPAPRPANSVLDNVAWRAAGYEPLRDFRAPLAELVAKLRGRTEV